LTLGGLLVWDDLKTMSSTNEVLYVLLSRVGASQRVLLRHPVEVDAANVRKAFSKCRPHRAYKPNLENNDKGAEGELLRFAGATEARMGM